MYINLYSFRLIGSILQAHKIPLLPALLDLFIFLIFKSKVPFSAKIGKGTYFSHRGIAVVFHPKAVVGERCVIGTCVTLGGRGKKVPGAPVIGNDVYIGTGAKILGPVRVGDGATIGANAVVISDVPAGATAVGVPARVIETDSEGKVVRESFE